MQRRDWQARDCPRSFTKGFESVWKPAIWDMGEESALKTMPVTGIDRRLLKRLNAFSPVAVRLMSVVADERVAFKEVARLISLDPVLSGEVLRLANSGLYGRRFEVCSILQAIAMLGSAKLSQIAMTAALWRGLPNRTAAFVREWWRHSIAAAFVSRQSARDSDVDCAYTAALLHGVGQLALYEDAPRDYPSLIERAYTGGMDLLEIERDAFGVDHATLAGLILESWGLPPKLCDAVARQHGESTGAGLALAVQTGCAGAEYAGFGRCGCHQCLATDVPEQLAEILHGDYNLDALVADINQIECSLG
jgi:HD-like signal output (HDOD) protein